MAKISGKELVRFHDALRQYFEQYNTEVDTSQIAEILNEWTGDEDRLYTHNGLRKGVHKILICTGAGNTIVGGADMWVNDFLNYVWPNLPMRKTWKLLIDSRRPANFKQSSLPKGLTYHFHGDNPEVTEEWLSEAQDIHVLHPHYHKRPHIWHHEDKFRTVFVHAYAKDIINVLEKIPELNQLQTQTNIDEKFYEEYLATFRKRVWIGNNHSSLLEDFPNFTYRIPNCYQFIHNIPLSGHIDNGKIGFASRAETRKCLHWLNGHKGFALTSQYDVQNLRDTTTYTIPDIDIYQWDPEIHHHFMLKNWGIFHGAYFQEPFGYSIFQAVDYGKLPILNRDWATELEYRYRAGTKMEFDKMVKTILKDSYETRLENFMKLKEYMLKFTNMDKWVDDIRNVLLR